MFPKDTGVPRDPLPVGSYNSAEVEAPYPHISYHNSLALVETDDKTRILYSGKCPLTDVEPKF